MPLTRRLVKGSELTLAEGDANLDTLEAAAAAALAAANAASAAAATKYLKPGTGVPIADMNATELAEYIRDTIAAALVAGTNVTVTVNDAGDTITISAAGGGSAGVTDGDKGDIVVSSAGGIWTIDPAVLSSAGRAVTSAADAAAQRTALGLGTAATQASSAFATAAQGAKADTALQTAPVTSVAGKTGAVTLTQADVAANTPVALTGATNLTAATHGNRQITFTGASATLTVTNDATGGWAADEEIIVQTLAGSAGVPTLSTPDGKTVTGSTTQPVGAKRKGANSWDVYLLPQTAGGGSGITVVRDLTQTVIPTGVTTESAVLKTLTLGALTAGMRVRVRGRLLGNNDAGTVTVRLKLGGTTVLTPVVSSSQSGGFFDGMIDSITTTSQGANAMLTQAVNNAVYTLSATSVDTSASVDLTVTGQHSTTTRTMTIMYLYAEVYPA